MPPGMALIVTLCGSNYRYLEQIFMVPKGFEPSKFDCIGTFKLLRYLSQLENMSSLLPVDVSKTAKHFVQTCQAEFISQVGTRSLYNVALTSMQRHDVYIIMLLTK